MGLWWEKLKKWEKVKNMVPVSTVVSFSGDKSAVPKSVPIVWRYMQDWQCLEVMSWRDHDHDGGYRLFFRSGSLRMRYRTILRARFVMVRVGTEQVSFWIEDTEGVAGRLVRTGTMVPAHRFRPDRSTYGSSSLSMLNKLGQIAWV